MRWLILTLGLVLTVGAYSQDKVDWERKYLEKPPKEESFDRRKWKEISKELDYSPIENEKAEKSEESLSKNQTEERDGPSFYIPGMQYLLYILAAAIIIVLLYFLVFKNLGNPGKRVRRTDLTLEDVEENLDRTDVLPLLERALRDGNFKLATRVYYLKCLKNLSEKNMIAWEKDKTNGEYLRELAIQELKRPFRGLTLQFERVWYGDIEIDKAHFEKLQPQFEAFLQLIDHHKNKAA